jgi:hypothetical protein
MSTEFSSRTYNFRTAKDIFRIGQFVIVGASYSEPFGTIVGLSDEYPFKAQVRLDHHGGFNGSTTCWIKIEHLL